MKKLYYIFSLAAVAALASCGGEKTEKSEGEDSATKVSTEQPATTPAESTTPAAEGTTPAADDKGTSVSVSKDGASVEGTGTKVEVSKDKASIQIKK